MTPRGNLCTLRSSVTIQTCPELSTWGLSNTSVYVTNGRANKHSKVQGPPSLKLGKVQNTRLQSQKYSGSFLWEPGWLCQTVRETDGLAAGMTIVLTVTMLKGVWAILLVVRQINTRI